MYGHMGVPITTTFEEIQFVESAKAESWFQLFDLLSKHITNILYAGYHTECISYPLCASKDSMQIKINIEI